MPRRPDRLLVRVLLALALLGSAPFALPHTDRAQPVALALEVAGKAETQVDGRTVPVRLLSEFMVGERLRVQRGARLTVLLYASGVPYSIDGPSLVRFGESSLEALSGNPPVNRRALSGKDGKPMRIQPSGVTEAATVLRSVAKPIPALTLSRGLTLEARPAFRWKAVEPGLEYQFTLRDASDNTVLARRVREPEVDLSGDPALVHGQAYRWTVSAKSAAGVSYASTYRFAVADRGRAEQVENFRPAGDAPVAEQVAFVVWLTQAGFADEAARQRERLAAVGVEWPEPGAGSPR